MCNIVYATSRLCEGGAYTQGDEGRKVEESVDWGLRPEGTV